MNIKCEYIICIHVRGRVSMSSSHREIVDIYTHVKIISLYYFIQTKWVSGKYDTMYIADGISCIPTFNKYIQSINDARTLSICYRIRECINVIYSIEMNIKYLSNLVKYNKKLDHLVNCNKNITTKISNTKYK